MGKLLSHLDEIRVNLKTLIGSHRPTGRS
jgi:hypothetical protein